MLQVLQFQVHNKHWQFDGSFFEMGGFLWRNASHGWETITRWGVAVLFPDWWPQIPLPAPGPSRSWGSPESTWPSCADASTDPQIPSLARPLGWKGIFGVLGTMTRSLVTCGGRQPQRRHLLDLREGSLWGSATPTRRWCDRRQQCACGKVSWTNKHCLILKINCWRYWFVSGFQLGTEW